MLKGTEDDPAVYMESVHYLLKMVAGAPNIRPAWFFDNTQQGEGLERRRHAPRRSGAVDAVSRAGASTTAATSRCSPRSAGPTLIDEAGLRARHRRARIPRGVRGGGQGRHARLLLQHARVLHAARRPHEAERDLGLGAGRLAPATRTTRSTRGRAPRSKCGRRRPTSCVPSSTSCPRAPPTRSAGRQRRPRARRGAAEGVRRRRRWRSAGREIHVAIPDTFRVGHEAHFAEVTREFLRMLRDRRALPAWERPNMLAKYFVTTRAPS